MIEERSSFAGESLRLEAGIETVIDFQTGSPLARHTDGSFVLPRKKGRRLLEIPGFFRRKSGTARKAAPPKTKS